MSQMETAQSRWLELLVDLLSDFDPSMPWAGVCQELGHQLQAPVTGRFQWDTQGITNVHAYPFPDWFDLPDVASRAPLLHPLARHYASTGSMLPHSTTELPFHRDPAARQYEAELVVDGIDQHLWIPVDVGTDEWLVMGVCRSHRSFDSDAMALAAVGQQVATAVHRHCAALSCWRKARQGEDQANVAVDLGLTPRQVAVLTLAAEGLTSVAIGHRLHVSPRTVEQHLRSTYERLNVHDRAAAVRRACLAGLIRG